MIDAATSLYGTASNEARQVQVAWAAVGVGNKLDLVKSGNGNGTINRSSGYLPAGYALNIYPPSDTVTLTAVPDSNSIFAGWYDDQCGWVYVSSASSYAAAMGSYRHLQAEFITAVRGRTEQTI